MVTTLTMGDGDLFTVLTADEQSLTLCGGRASDDGGWTQDRYAPTVDMSTFATTIGSSVEIGWMNMLEGFGMVCEECPGRIRSVLPDL